MVYEAKKVMKEVMEPHRYCDVCGNEINIELVCNTARCMYCGKDLCEKCIEEEENTYNDSRIVWCENCWKLGELYRPRIEKLQEEIKRLCKRWQDDCQKVILKS